MLLIIIALVAGCTLGILGWIPNKAFLHLDKFIIVTLFCMLFSLGVQIGINQELLNNLTLLGGQAALIAGFATLGSIIVLWLACRLLKLLPDN